MPALTHGRALPLYWLVVRGSKGHFPEQTHRELRAQLQALVPVGATVIFLGDGEFDGIELQADLQAYGWQYVCRTASNLLVTCCGVQFHLRALGPPRGEYLAVSLAWLTAKQYGPLSILALWDAHEQHPLYLVTNLADLDAAVRLYKKRAHIETFFSDQQSRGFHIHKSHLSEPARLSRLLVASCLGMCGWSIAVSVRCKMIG